jgi:Xaa-Pro aminopeptidase
LSAHLPLVSEVRNGAGFFYFLAGDAEERLGERFTKEVDDALRQHGGRNRRLAIDKMEISGIEAIQRLGVEIKSGQQVMEHARLVKSENDIRAMRCVLATCEIAVEAMRQALTSGIAEVELWSVLHAENIKRGGEWIETRILSSGPRTNPWMQEAGPRIIRDAELLGFDTDLIGPYGYCADISRTWYCGEGKPSDEQRHLYQVAHEHIMTNMSMLAPGVSFRELTEKGHRLPEEYRAQRYGVSMHGVGLCDEFPAIYYPEDFIEGAFDYILEPGMTLCVEAYIGEVGGREGVKLEDQVLITETGVENLTHCPFDEGLMA